MARYFPVEMYLFDTCTHKCGYCWLAESGLVLDTEQLKPYRDPKFISQITGFFNKRTSEEHRFNLILTGGEPLLMPHLPMFCDSLWQYGNQVSMYTALLVGYSHPSFKAILASKPGQIGYIMASLHPESEEQDGEFFEKAKLIKDAGHKILVRYVGHPSRLGNLKILSEKCERMGVCFYPTTIFSNQYPRAYTTNEKDKLIEYFTTKSQRIQIEGGIDTTDVSCHAGSKMISINMASGDITPCISVKKPVIGNIFRDELDLFTKPIRCPDAGIACICDVHFQQDIVINAEDSALFARACSGKQKKLSRAENDRMFGELKLPFATTAAKMGNVRDNDKLYFDTETVRQALNDRKQEGRAYQERTEQKGKKKTLFKKFLNLWKSVAKK